MSNELENFLYETTFIVYTIKAEMFIAIEIYFCVYSIANLIDYWDLIHNEKRNIWDNLRN